MVISILLSHAVMVIRVDGTSNADWVLFWTFPLSVFSGGLCRACNLP
jgi:hypothetical protein